MNILSDSMAALRLELEKRIEPLMTAVVDGRCGNWEDYREKVGQIRALREARDLTLPQGVKRESTTS